MHNEEHRRGKLFKSVIENLQDYEVKTGATDISAHINVYFNFSNYDNNEALLITEMLELCESDTLTIFDVSDEEFLSSPLIEYYLLLIAAANFVTCSSEFIQESIYEQTGRLAYLVADPAEESDFKTPSYSYERSFEKLDTLWFGEVRDIMSIRPFITSIDDNIRIATTGYISHTKDRADMTVIRTDKRKEEEIDKADIVYLPPTHNRQGEINRYRKVEECIKAGKFVVAPALDYDFDALAKDTDLKNGKQFFKNLEDPNQYVKAKQEYLKKKYSRENTESSLHTALELTPEDAFQQSLEEVLGEEIILL